MKSNFEISLKHVLKHEGGYVDHPRDPGGATNLGVTIKTLSRWLKRPASKAEVRALTVEKVMPIYRAWYWDEVRADTLPSGVDVSVFDAAVNSGPARAERWLDEANTVPGDVYMRFTAIDTIKAYAKRRLSFLQALRTWQTFGRGWSRRVAEVEAFSLRLALGPIAKAELPREAAKAKATANKQTAAGAATGAAAPPAIAHSPPGPVLTDSGSTEIYVLFALVAIAAAYLFWRSYINRQRAAALNAEAADV
jgi:lysozyme family protein